MALPLLLLVLAQPLLCFAGRMGLDADPSTSVLGRAGILEVELEAQLQAGRGDGAPAGRKRSRSSAFPAEADQGQKYESDIERVFYRKVCLMEVRDRFMRTLGRLVPPGTQASLMYVPTHYNYGDTFITFGEIMATMTAGIRLEAQCREFDDKCADNAIAALDRDGMMLYHGGGNFGDIWPAVHKAKWEYLKKALKHRVVFMPQSVWYNNDTNAKYDAISFRESGHRDNHLFVRSRFSYEYTMPRFRGAITSITLIPDVALNIGPVFVPASHQPLFDVLYLKRRDSESTLQDLNSKDQLAGYFEGLTFNVTDWFDLEDGGYAVRGPPPEKKILSPFAPTELAIQRTVRSGKLLRKGRVVITDRLHATILSLLTDIPVVALDNSYGKIRKVTEVIYESSAKCRPAMRHYTARTLPEAVQIVKEVLKVLDSQPAAPEAPNEEMERTLQRHMCFEELRNEYMDAYMELAPENWRTLLLGAPNRGMDSADPLRWYGEIMANIYSDAKLTAQCYKGEMDCVELAMRLAPTIDKTTVMVHGGPMNMDLVQQYRELIGWRRIVVSGPSWGTSGISRAGLARAAEAWKGKRVSLFTYSKRDYNASVEALGDVVGSVKLLPHPAVNIGPLYLPSELEPEVDVLFLVKDGEPEFDPEDIQTVLGGLTFKVATWAESGEGYYDPQRQSPFASVERAMQICYARGRLLRQGRVIVTSDAQAALLGMLFDIPTVNVRGKSNEILDVIYKGRPHCSRGMQHLPADSYKRGAHLARMFLN